MLSIYREDQAPPTGKTEFVDVREMPRPAGLTGRRSPFGIDRAGLVGSRAGAVAVEHPLAVSGVSPFVPV